MAVEISQFGPDDTESLRRYQQIPMEFEVESILEVRTDPAGFGSFSLEEVAVESPWTKDLWDGRYEIE